MNTTELTKRERLYLKDAVKWGINDLEDESNQPLSAYGEEELYMLKALWNKLNK